MLADADMVPLLLLPLLWGGEWGGWGEGDTAWGGAEAATEPLGPPGSLQELLGFELQVQESVAVQACMDVRVPCSFSYHWYPWYPSVEPLIYWFREGDGPHSDPVATNTPKRPVKTETQGRFRLLGDPSDKDCSLSISDARMSDTGVYYFRVERDDVKYSYRDKKLSLQVTGMAGAQERTLGCGDLPVRMGTGRRTTPGLGMCECRRDPGLGVSCGP